MPTTLANFRAQIARAVRAFTLALPEVEIGRTSPVCARPVASEMADRFTNLHNSCELLMAGFEALDQLMETYVHHVPLANQTAANDAEGFLEWLATRVDLTEEQVDLIVCQQSRHSVEFVAVRQRLAHARFQELLSNNRRLLAQLGRNRTITIHLNPVHVWATLETHVLLHEAATIPATVLFYPVGENIEGAVVEADIIPLLQHLNRRPSRLDQLSSTLPAYDRHDLIDILQELANLGIVALG